jgi:soluble lytic murein transglycosylase-like protein
MGRARCRLHAKGPPRVNRLLRFYNSQLPMRLLAASLTLASTALAGEYAVLSTGMRLYADRHEQKGSKIVLYSAAGSTELEASQVSAFEHEEYIAPQPVAAAPAAAAVRLQEVAQTPRQLVEAAAQRNGIPPKLLHSVVAAESGYRPEAVSPKGAIGLMQLMPATAQAYGVDPHDPAQNVEAGTAYFRDLLLKYKGDVPSALAAYNAGPGAVEKYKDIPPYPETRAYVGRVIRSWQKKPAE